MLRRWIAAASLMIAAIITILGYVYSGNAAEPMAYRAAQLKMWLFDSTGGHLAMADSDTVYAYIAQGDSTGTTIYARQSHGDTSYIFTTPDTTDIYTIAYRNPMHNYVLIDSFFFPGRHAAEGSVQLGALLAGSVPESAIVAGAVCPRHLNADSSYTLSIGDSSTVALASLPASVFNESEFGTWFAWMLADTLPAWLADSTAMFATAASLFPARVDTSMYGAVTWGFTAADTTQTAWKSGAATGDLVLCGWSGAPQLVGAKNIVVLSGEVTASKKVVLHRDAETANVGEEAAWFVVIGKP
jgi:hypothetical protein